MTTATSSVESGSTDDVTSHYRVVYHFLDDHLFKTFIAKIPRSQIVDFLRANQSLRNRYFPGFRISNTVPTEIQLLKAYKKEIVDHSNNKLASLLCAQWIRQQPMLASVALKSLGIQAENPADVSLWMKDVHEMLTSEPDEKTFRPLVLALARQFPSDDLRIFISIISYPTNQQTLRALVEDELANVAKNPQIMKEQIEGDLAAARTRIQHLEELGSALKSQLQGDLTEATETLDNALREDDELATRLAEDEACIQELTNQSEGIKAKLAERQNTRDTTKNQKQKLSKVIALQPKSGAKCAIFEQICPKIGICAENLCSSP